MIEVVRAFIPRHNQLTQFAEKSAFHLAALRASNMCMLHKSQPKAGKYWELQHQSIHLWMCEVPYQNTECTKFASNICNQLMFILSLVVSLTCVIDQEKGSLNFYSMILKYSFPSLFQWCSSLRAVCDKMGDAGSTYLYHSLMIL